MLLAERAKYAAKTIDIRLIKNDLLVIFCCCFVNAFNFEILKHILSILILLLLLLLLAFLLTLILFSLSLLLLLVLLL